MFQKLAGRTPLPLGYAEYKKYAVIAPFLPGTQEFLFEVRSQKLHRGPGEICFPGGYIEDGETALEAGIREATEELLIRKEDITMIAPLDILISPHNGIVSPYLAEIRNYHFTFNQSEVESVFTVPFDFFLNQEPLIYHNRLINVPEDPAAVNALLGTTAYPWREGRYPVLFYQYENKLIWGMTARFIHNVTALYCT